MHLVPLLAISPDGAGLLVALDLSAMMIMAIAAIGVLRTPSASFTAQWLGKGTWALACVLFNLPIGSLVVPLGALLAIWRVRQLRRRSPGQPGAVPFASGYRVDDKGRR